MGNLKAIEWIRDGDCFRSIGHSFSDCGYPRMQRDHKYMSIARHILGRRLGKLPVSVHARHTCDHKWCIRPDHIIEGSNADNMKDKRGRIIYRRGENHGNAKLSDKQITEIRELLLLGLYQRQIAEKFGVDRTLISRIKRGVNRRQPPISPQSSKQLTKG